MSLKSIPKLRSTLTVCATAAFALLGASAAFAGSCPKDQVLSVPMKLASPPDVGTTQQVLYSVDLTGWRGVDDLMLRTRRLVVTKDGFVPLHQHNDRPAMIYVVSGEIIEHNALCGQPIVHRAGDSTPEFGKDHAHWWENKSGHEVVLISTDIVPRSAVTN